MPVPDPVPEGRAYVPSEPLEAARLAVAESDRWQGSGAEIPALRTALRALIQWCEERERDAR